MEGQNSSEIPNVTVSRRRLIGTAAIAAAGAALAACAAPAAPTAAPPASTAPKDTPAAKAPAPAATTAPKPAATQAQAPAAPKALEKVSLRLDWLFVGYHAPFFLGVDKGWYRDVGLDVTIGEGKGSGSTLQLVASGGDTFGYASGASLVQAAAATAPVVMLSTIVQKGAEALIVREESDIKTLKDLEGRSWGGAPSATSGQLLPGLFKANGVDINKVKVISVDNSVKTQGWLEAKYDAMSSLVNDEMVKLAIRGIKFRAFPYGDYGIITMGHGIATNAKVIQDKPDLVKNFVAASMKAWKYSFEKPQEALVAMKKIAPDAQVDEAVVAGQLKATIALTQTDNSKGKPLGWMSDKDWQKTIDLMVEYTGLKDKPVVEKIFTNQFVPND